MMQTEDEIAAIGMCVGASFGGTKAMTSTAGPGLSLMTEFLGLASIAEIPIVIADIQRVGPSTGIPTKTEQCDFAHAAHAGPGDTPRVVVAPYDVADCFHMAIEAFNIAEEYQTPVLLLSDQYLGQRKESVAPFDIHRWPVVDRVTYGGNGSLPYRRYRLDDGAVSPMAIPGQAGGEHTISGLEHVESGDPTSSSAVHARMNARRHAKLERLARERGPALVQTFGAEHPKLGIVCWGSTSAQAREAARRLNREGHSVGVCVPQLLCPLPVEPIAAFLASVERAVWVELNHQGQFYHWAKARLDLDPARSRLYARSGGMPFSVEEIVGQVLAMAGA
jgi:2-oxoglutarate ferredoxin oxidoreductase subunit alpha